LVVCNRNNNNNNNLIKQFAKIIIIFLTNGGLVVMSKARKDITAAARLYRVVFSRLSYLATIISSNNPFLPA